MDKRGIRTPKQMAHSKKFTQRFAFGDRSKWDSHKRFDSLPEIEPLEKFDCSNCGDPTHGSYQGAIMSNMCWKCTLSHNECYDEWLDSLNLKARKDYEE